MYYRFYNENTYEINPTWETIWEDRNDYKKIIPAWSLHRIMSIVYSNKPKKNGLGLAIIQYDNPFEDMIQKIEWLIKEGYFNKEYLNGSRT
jgi:hypothetical protein